ncbi:MAG: hypothetical protein AB8B74_02835 [Crocinitomicaceae bacterium]
MIDCEEAAYIVDTMPHKPTGLLKRLGLKMHLVICPECTKYVRDSKAVDHILRYVNQHAASLTADEKKLMIEKLNNQLSD